ncbi:hypothetical protein QJS10_CPB04g00996 [Acorus calamus]|uniref:Uncharacterized protein n=1 Tax=Acorus calamus TaxID=4465 RepID=A0AAV9EYA4_ACOCL|nr:hypothetical protein QJS10_CPB04g00996 [Acorus calamus]
MTVGDDWAWDEQKDEEEERGAMHSSLWLLDHVDHDLLRVENQMPFFVVEALFDLLVPQQDGRPTASIYDLAMNLLNRFEPSDTYDATLKNPKSVHHLFHLYYEMVVGYNNSDDDTEKSSSSVQEQERINLIDRGFLKIKKTTQGFLLHLRDAMPITFP